MFSRVCTLHTLSPVYIYTLEPQCLLLLSSHSLALSRRSLSACSCSLHTLSPSPNLNKTSLASLSPHCCSKSQQDPSAGKGRRTFHPAAAREGLRPLLLRHRPVDRRT